jgi:hypothetical protein
MSRRQALPLCRRLGWERPARGRIVVRALAALSRIVALGGDDRRVGAVAGAGSRLTSALAFRPWAAIASRRLRADGRLARAGCAG